MTTLTTGEAPIRINNSEGPWQHWQPGKHQSESTIQMGHVNTENWGSTIQNQQYRRAMATLRNSKVVYIWDTFTFILQAIADQSIFRQRMPWWMTNVVAQSGLLWNIIYISPLPHSTTSHIDIYSMTNTASKHNFSCWHLQHSVCLAFKCFLSSCSCILPHNNSGT